MPKKETKKITSLLKRLVVDFFITLIASYLVSQTVPTCVHPQAPFENQQFQAKSEIVRLK